MTYQEFRRRVLEWLWHYCTLDERHWSNKEIAVYYDSCSPEEAARRITKL